MSRNEAAQGTLLPRMLFACSVRIGFIHHPSSVCNKLYLLHVSATHQADFYTKPGVRISMMDGSTDGGVEAESPWFCGLHCRQMKGCLGYNWWWEGKECQLVKVKRNLLKNGKMIRGNQTVYQEEHLSDWTFYERKY